MRPHLGKRLFIDGERIQADERDVAIQVARVGHLQVQRLVQNWFTAAQILSAERQS